MLTLMRWALKKGGLKKSFGIEAFVYLEWKGMGLFGLLQVLYLSVDSIYTQVWKFHGSRKGQDWADLSASSRWERASNYRVKYTKELLNFLEAVSFSHPDRSGGIGQVLQFALAKKGGRFFGLAQNEKEKAPTVSRLLYLGPGSRNPLHYFGTGFSSGQMI